MNTDLLNRVPGGPELIAWFGGYAPRFHDAEVLGLTLDREGATCSLRVHGFEMTSEIDARGYIVCTKHVVVTFLVSDLTELELSDFGSQNALMGLSIDLVWTPSSVSNLTRPMVYQVSFRGGP